MSARAPQFRHAVIRVPPAGELSYPCSPTMTAVTVERCRAAPSHRMAGRPAGGHRRSGTASSVGSRPARGWTRVIASHWQRFSVRVQLIHVRLIDAVPGIVAEPFDVLPFGVGCVAESPKGVPVALPDRSSCRAMKAVMQPAFSQTGAGASAPAAHLRRRSPDRRPASERWCRKREATDQCMKSCAPAASLPRCTLPAAVRVRAFPPLRSGRRTCSRSAVSDPAHVTARLRCRPSRRHCGRWRHVSSSLDDVETRLRVRSANASRQTHRLPDRVRTLRRPPHGSARRTSPQ